MWNLSEAEKAVYNQVIKGSSNLEVAERLFVGEKTIKFHLTNIYKKLGINSRAQLLAYESGNLYKKENEVNYIERLPHKGMKEENQTNLPQKTQEDRVKFVNESFGVNQTIGQLQHMMKEVTKDELNPSTVNAACNCVARLNETIDVAIKAARFLNER